MLDNRKKLLNTKTQDNNLKDRKLTNYHDESQNSILGFGKLIYHPEKIIGVKQGKNAFPITATVSLGNYCNHACLWCSTYFWQQETSNTIDYNKLTKWVNKASLHGLKSIIYVGNGEPLAYKKFPDLTKFIFEKKLDQGIFTNGFLINRYFQELEKFFTFVRISLDAGSSKVHSKLHDVPESHFPKIIDNIKNLVKKRKNKIPTIGIQFATHQENINDIENSVKIAKDIGVDYFSIKPVFDRGSVNKKIKKNSLSKDDFDKAFENVAKYISNEFKIFYRPQQIISESNNQNMLIYNKCYAGFFGVNVYEDGSITGCGPHHIPVGHLDTPLKKLEKNIINLSNKLDLKNCPSGCRYHPLNFQLHKILNSNSFSKEEHINLF